MLLAAIVAWLALQPASTMSATFNVEVRMGPVSIRVIGEAGNEGTVQNSGRSEPVSKERGKAPGVCVGAERRCQSRREDAVADDLVAEVAPLSEG